jgi:hypothetical protein
MLEIENALSRDWNKVLSNRITMFISRATQKREREREITALGKYHYIRLA